LTVTTTSPSTSLVLRYLLGIISLSFIFGSWLCCGDPRREVLPVGNSAAPLQQLDIGLGQAEFLCVFDHVAQVLLDALTVAALFLLKLALGHLVPRLGHCSSFLGTF
jgi:hypothetical protein